MKTLMLWVIMLITIGSIIFSVKSHAQPTCPCINVVGVDGVSKLTSMASVVPRQTTMISASQPSGLTVLSEATTVGTTDTLKIMSGFGIKNIISNMGAQIGIQSMVDPAVIQTLANTQAGKAIICASHGNENRNYTCSMNPTLTTYSVGMIVGWLPDVNSGTGITLNIDSLGSKEMNLFNVVKGEMYLIWFDGRGWRRLL